MNFIPIKRLTVRREFSAGREPGSLDLRRDCGLGCACAATLFKCGEPSERLAEQKSLCFNDATRQGISELQGTARRVLAPTGSVAFEVAADLVEGKK